MKKRLFITLFVSVLLILSLTIPAVAGVSSSPRVVDKADLLTDEQEADLTAKLAEYSEKQNCDIVFLTEPDMDHEDYTFYQGNVPDFADRYYETHGYDADGMLVLILLEDGRGSRKIQFSCSGKCMKRLTDDEQNEIIDNVYLDLKSGSYYAALNTISTGINDKLTPQLKWYVLPLSILIGFVIAMLIMLGMKGKLKTVTMQHGAKSYVRPGSMHVTASRDTYLYSNVTRTARQSESSGGGSSRTSSGGGSHSGVGRSF
jgi:uncharacterized protein